MMAKKRASKAAVKATGGAKRHPPAMYPDPAPIELATPQKVVAFDPKTRLITLQGPPPPELLAAEEAHRHRLNLNTRIKQYALSCVLRIEPHWGERPKHISPAKWKNRELRVRAMAELPESAPADAHDALKALHTLNLLADELVKADDWPDAIDRALCYAIDLGQLLQRGQTQRDYGEIVDTGKRSKQSLNKGPEARTEKAKAKSEAAREELKRRLVGNNRSPSDHLDDMAEEGKWGGRRMLSDYCKGIARPDR